MVTFPGKDLEAERSIKAWVFFEVETHLFIVNYYFQVSAPWKYVLLTEHKTPSKNYKDFVYAVHGFK